MTQPESSHAAVVGLSGSAPPGFQESTRWATCIARSASRCSGSVFQSIDAGIVAAYRGKPAGFFKNNVCTLMVDGHVDNLEDIASKHGDMSCKRVSQAELLAWLFAVEGNSVFAKLTGSYAVAAITNSSGETLLVRDRFGTKPLFYARSGSSWVWASELKLIRPLLDSPGIDSDGLTQAIHYRYMVGETLIENVRQVLPASLVCLAPGKASIATPCSVLRFTPMASSHDLDHWVDRTDSALDDSFSGLRRSHRDIGVLLSGGVDSSLLALKASQAGFRNCIAFTARWPGENPELEWAQKVARHLGIEHRVVDIDETYIQRALPWLVWRMEEAPRHYNSFTIASLFEAASTSCDALLNGHAADVMFGPQSCVAINMFIRRQAQLDFIPRHLRTIISKLLPEHPRPRIGRLKRYLSADLHELMQTQFQIGYGGSGDKAFSRYPRLGKPGRECLDRFYDPTAAPTERFQVFDLYTFNQTHLAVFDRLGAPLGVTIETPFLSPQLTAVASELPSHLKFDGAMAKPVLKRLAARHFPKEWIYRTKQGFPTQTSRWMRGPLQQWRIDLLGNQPGIQVFLDTDSLSDAKVGRDDEAIWTAMTLEMFRLQFISNEGGPETSPWQ